MRTRQALVAGRAARDALSGCPNPFLMGKNNAASQGFISTSPRIFTHGLQIPHERKPLTWPLTRTGAPEVYHGTESFTEALCSPFPSVAASAAVGGRWGVPGVSRVMSTHFGHGSGGQERGVPGVWRGMSTHVGHGSGGRERGPELHTPPESHPFAVRGLNHIALAVPDLEGAAEHYRTVFGAQVSDPHELAEHGVRVVYVHVGATTLELLQPLGTGSAVSPIAKFLERNPRGGVHHLCFTVDNIETAGQHVAEEGVKVLGNFGGSTAPSEAPGGPGSVPHPAVGTHGNPVLFLDPRDNLGVLCELEQVFCHER